MADLSNLDGISNARSELYNRLEKGEITETKAMAQERVLRGQTELKATIPLRLLSIVAKTKNATVKRYGEPLMRAVLRFTTGEDIPPEVELKNSPRQITGDTDSTENPTSESD